MTLLLGCCLPLDTLVFKWDNLAFFTRVFFVGFSTTLYLILFHNLIGLWLHNSIGFFDGFNLFTSFVGEPLIWRFLNFGSWGWNFINVFAQIFDEFGLLIFSWMPSGFIFKSDFYEFLILIWFSLLVHNRCAGEWNWSCDFLVPVGAPIFMFKFKCTLNKTK